MVLVAHALKCQVPVVDFGKFPPRFFQLFAVRDVAHGQDRIACVVVALILGQGLVATGVLLVRGCGAAVGPSGLAFGFCRWWFSR